MRRIAVLVLVLAAIGHGTGMDAQRQGGANPAGRQGGAAPAGRQGGVPAGGRQGGRAARDRVEPTGTAVIRGRVVTADSGAPVRRAEVQATAGGSRPRVTLTDANGIFELHDLPAGTWLVRASKSGFVPQQFGQRGAFGPAEQITLGDGQQFTAPFALTRAGAITGRVFDEFGDPIANVRVGALRVQWTPAGRRLAAAGATVMTDDTGAYRVYGLAPGRYYVSATLMTPAINNGALTTAEGPITYSAVYFPGTTDLAQAQPIEVGLGQEQTSINVSLTPLPAARVSGVVIGTNGTPAQAFVNLHHPALDEIAGAGGRGMRSASDGTFTLTGVSPGSYTLEVMTQPRSPNDTPEVASLPITVNAEDLSGLTVTLTRGGTIEGTVATDNGTRLQTEGIRVTAPAMRAGQRTFQPRAQVAAGGSFGLAGLIGPHSLRFEQLPAGWTVKSVTANGTDITDLALDFRGTEQVSVRVVLTDRISLVSGTIRGDTAPGASVVVFPDEPAKWTSLSRFLRTVRAGDTGQFTLRGLPTHSRYLAVALDYIENGEHLNPDFLQRLRSAATSFSLGEGGQETIEVPLVSRP